MAPKRKSISYYLRRPGQGGRATFAIYKKKPSGQERVKSEALEAINTRYKNNKLSLDEANDLANEVLFALQKSKRNWNASNVKLADEYWNAVYKGRDLKRPEAAKWRIKQALQALGELSIYSATRDELITKLEKHPQQRRLASTLNRLLKYVKRDVVLPRQRKRRTKVRYISIDEFKLLLPHWSPDYRLLAITAFATGARQGECFALDRVLKSERGSFAPIEEQILRTGEPDETKTGGTRRAPIVSEFVDDVKKWIDTTNKADLRRLRHADIIRDACKVLWPKSREKHLTFHDLRHCYAIHLLSKGVPLDHVAAAIGDTIGVCQEYYVGFELSTMSLDAVLAKI